MIVTENTKKQLSVRRFRRNIKNQGYRPVDEFGYEVIWEMNRGFITNHVIKDVIIDIEGKSLWVKTEVKE